MDWSEEAIAEEDLPALRRRTARPRTPKPAGTSAGARPSSPPLSWISGGSRPSSPPPGRTPGSRSPSPRRARAQLGSRSPSPPRSSIMATRFAGSVRTTRRAPRLSGGVDVPESSGEAGSAEEILASLREGRETLRLLAPRDDDAAAAGSAASAGGGGADEEEEEGASGFSFSFPLLHAPPSGGDGDAVEEVKVAGRRAGSFSFPHLQTPPAVDGAEVLDAFAGSEAEEARKAKAGAEFLEATMGANTGPRTEAIKKELVVNRRVLDVEGLERWLRRTELAAELAWFADLCSDEDKPAPPLDLFECAFRALEGASSGELHRGADARKRWIGSVAVPEFFVCPISKKVMEHPVVISSGKTVDRSALEKWWKKNERICPVTGEILGHTVSIPNILITLCISLWRKANNIADTPAVTDAPPAISPQKEARFKQVTLMAHSPGCSKEASDALFLFHDLINKERSFVHLLGRHPGAIAKLASVLPETCLDPDPELDDVVLGIMATAASYGPNKAAIGDDQYAIPVLVARAWLGPLPARAKCAHILGLLADDYYNKIKIGELGGLAALVELLAVGDAGFKKTAARALASLCEAQENRSRFVREGVADAAIALLREDGLVVETQAILLQSQGFELAMAQILERLKELGGEMCEKMRKRLWYNFVMTGPRQRWADAPSSSAAAAAKVAETASTSSSEASAEGSAAEHEQTKKDVKAIVSWMQKKCYYPRTYRYRS